MNVSNKWVQLVISFVLAGIAGAGWTSVLDPTTAAAIVTGALSIEGVLHLTKKAA